MQGTCMHHGIQGPQVVGAGTAAALLPPGSTQCHSVPLITSARRILLRAGLFVPLRGIS